MPVAASFPVQPELDERLSRRRNVQINERNVGGEEEDAENGIIRVAHTFPSIPFFKARSTDSVDSSTSNLHITRDIVHRDATMSGLHFLSLQNATTCQSYFFSWLYDGPVLNSNLTLSVVQNPQIYSDMMDTRVLTTDLPTSATNFTWQSVDLPQGWYMLQGTIDDPGVNFLPHMSPLYVINGTNTSCVKDFQPETSSHTSRLDTGDIVGVVIGAIAAACLLSVAFAFPRLWRRELPTLKKRRPYYLY
jgi:hypothetical protein